MNHLIALSRTFVLFAGLFITLSASAQNRESQFNKFKVFLDYYNQTNPTKIAVGRWYRLDDLAHKGHDLVGLMGAAEKHGINLVIELPGSYRYLTEAQTTLYYQQASEAGLRLGWYKGIRYEEKPADFESYTAYGDERLELNGNNRYHKKAYFLIPGNESILQSTDLSQLDWHDEEADLLKKALAKYSYPSKEVRTEVAVRMTRIRAENQVRKIRDRANGNTSRTRSRKR